MVDRPTRTSNGGEPRGDDIPEWEVFVRADRDERLRHVGSVSAATPETAHDHASRLFAWYATDVWICPAGAVHRFSEHEDGEADTSDEGAEADTSDGDAEVDTSDEGAEADASDDDAEQPVTGEGTEGPTSSDGVEPRVREL